MNREIEFRGMCINGSWVHGNLSVLTKKFKDVPAGYYISNSGGAPFAYEIRPETVGQFTGLLDKNGVKIFECDILKNDYGLYQVCFGEYYGDCQQHHEFGWHMKKNGSIMGMNNCESNYDQMEVIGNIFESHELLEEK